MNTICIAVVVACLMDQAGSAAGRSPTRQELGPSDLTVAKVAASLTDANTSDLYTL